MSRVTRHSDTLNYAKISKVDTYIKDLLLRTPLETEFLVETRNPDGGCN